MKHDFDTQIEKELKLSTEMNHEEKELIWDEISERISDETRIKRNQKQKKNKKNKFLVLSFVTFAAVLTLFIGSQSKIGHALIDQVKILFEPEKEIVQSIEGMDEEGTVNLHEGTEAEYVIYVDEERYTFSKSEDMDKIVAKNHPESYPYVGMDIQQVIDKEPLAVLEELRNEWTDSNYDITPIAAVDYPFDALSFRVKEGNVHDSEIIKFLAISNGKQGSFVFKQYYFLEAEEGHGARLSEMLKEFYIIDQE